MFALELDTEDSRRKKGRGVVIAIDGPSGAGKSTLARRLARELGYIYLDTGAMFRALALKLLRQGVDLADDAQVRRLVQSTDIDIREQGGRLIVLLDGQDVAAEIRTPEVSQMASKASARDCVRARLLDLQRSVGQRGSVVAEGRDIGTVVFPQAEVKIFLDASTRERARRRFRELRAAGSAVELDETLREMTERDNRDRERDLAPLRQAEDAVLIDSSSIDADQVATMALELVKRKAREN